MSSNPINLALRFVLELAALAAMAYWGWTQHAGIWRVVWGVGLPLLASILWGTFRVPGDPGNAPVAVPGPVRLLIEAAVFVTATWCLYAAGRPVWAAVFGVVVVVHYLLSYDRVLNFLANRLPER